LKRTLLAVAVLAVSASANAQEDGCSKDTDCKGDRICVARTCVDPAVRGRGVTRDPEKPAGEPSRLIANAWGGAGFRSVRIAGNSDSHAGLEGGGELGARLGETIGVVGVVNANVTFLGNDSALLLYQLGAGLNFRTPVRFSLGPTLSLNAVTTKDAAGARRTSDAKASGGVFVHAWYAFGGAANIGIHGRAALDGLTDGNSQLSLSLGLGVSTN
jgi:hypothetical protein